MKDEIHETLLERVLNSLGKSDASNPLIQVTIEHEIIVNLISIIFSMLRE